MKQILWILIIATFFYLICPNFKSANAQFDLLGSKMAGVNCGVPGHTAKGLFDRANPWQEINECCPRNENKLCPDLAEKVLGFVPAGFANKIPLVGPAINDYNAWCDEMKKIQDKVGDGQCVFGEVDRTKPGKCYCVDDGLVSDPLPAVRKMCEKYVRDNPAELKSCIYCASGQFEDGKAVNKEVFDRGYWTGLGCIPTDFDSFITHFVMKIGIGFAGVIALLCIIFSAIMIQTSAGNAEKVKKAQQNMTSCILGLILIIFSIFILRLIGVDILGIPFLK